MITTKTLTDKTGLSAKTLTRWSNQGVIPKPAISTHPSGRGKVGYWPDSVLDRCLRIVQLRKEGHSLESAIVVLGLEHYQKCSEIIEKPSVADLLAQRKVKVNGEEVDLLEVFRAAIAGSLKDSVLDRDHHRTILMKLHADDRLLLRSAIHLFGAAYEPFLTYDGTTVRIEADFLLGHPRKSEGHATFALPLRPALRKLFALFKAEERIPEARVSAAPKVWAREGDVIVEYDIFLGGSIGFELIRELARTVGTTRESGDNLDPKG